MTKDVKAKLILDYFDEILPDADCELVYNNDIQLLIAVLLSAQTTDKSVNIATAKLFRDYPDVYGLASLTVAQIEQYIKSLGLFRVKAVNVNKTCNIIVNEYDGKVPSDFNALVSLPGVGRKTANVMLAEYFKIPAFAVDVHVNRVSKRLRIGKEADDVLKIEMKLRKMFPKDKWIKLHHQFIHFGRYFCKSSNPNCSECKLTHICKYYKSK